MPGEQRAVDKLRTPGVGELNAAIHELEVQPYFVLWRDSRLSFVIRHAIRQLLPPEGERK